MFPSRLEVKAMSPARLSLAGGGVAVSDGVGGSDAYVEGPVLSAAEAEGTAGVLPTEAGSGVSGAARSVDAVAC